MSLYFTTCTLPDDDYEGIVEWLKHHVEPVETVQNYMEKTSIKRAAWIEMDFDLLFKDVKDNPFLKWTPSFSEKVIKYANRQGNWKEYLHIDHDMKIDSDECKMIVSLCLLPAILPPGRQQSKKRSSVDDAIKAFINVKPVGTNLPKYLEESLIFCCSWARGSSHSKYLLS
ncbi:Hypothetical predicted protein [Paramuricea clavata]|uniref:Uncharacterized protein n=1 Tax=Paramuricea clavata TaxID=317549 RepID=A0A7D9D698_PARCT|nr:Hypothetical predicted protein [Paramuricea clavata]